LYRGKRPRGERGIGDWPLASGGVHRGVSGRGRKESPSTSPPYPIPTVAFLPPSLGFDPSPCPLCVFDFLPRRVRSILSPVIYPSSLGVLIPIYRSFCYLSFCVFFFLLQKANGPIAVTCESRFAVANNFSHRRQHWILHSAYISQGTTMAVYRKNNVVKEIIV